MTLIEELADWASALSYDEIPEDVVEIAKLQVLSQCAAIRLGAAHPLGRRFIAGFGEPLQSDSRRSAFVLAGLGAWLHFDDTAFAGHLSNSTVTVPLGYAAEQGLDGRRLLTSVVAATETAARITAAATLGWHRGQTSAYSHITGAIAGRLRGADAPAEHWADALGLGFGMPPRTIQAGFLGGDSKVFSSATPVAIGLDACDAAAVGFAGNRSILEAPAGFLATFADIPLPDFVTTGFGERWHTHTTSFKVHPGGPGMDVAIDCGIELHRELGPVRPADVATIDVDTSVYTLLVDRWAGEHMRGPDSPVGALVFSLPYLLATTLLTGGVTVADYTPERLADRERWELADLVNLHHDQRMTFDLFHCEVPFGEGLRQAGPRAAEWLAGFGTRWQGDGQWLVDLVGEFEPPSKDFSTARKATPARVTVRFKDRRTVVRERDVPVGGVGAIGDPPLTEQMRDKFVGTGGSADVADRLLELETVPADEIPALLRAALA